MAADFLDETRTALDARLKELKPLVDEYELLKAAASALDGVAAISDDSATRRRAQARAKAPDRRDVSARAADAGGRKVVARAACKRSR